MVRTNGLDKFGTQSSTRCADVASGCVVEVDLASLLAPRLPTRAFAAGSWSPAGFPRTTRSCPCSQSQFWRSRRAWNRMLAWSVRRFRKRLCLFRLAWASTPVFRSRVAERLLLGRAPPARGLPVLVVKGRERSPSARGGRPAPNSRAPVRPGPPAGRAPLGRSKEGRSKRGRSGSWAGPPIRLDLVVGRSEPGRSVRGRNWPGRLWPRATSAWPVRTSTTKRRTARCGAAGRGAAGSGADRRFAFRLDCFNLQPGAVWVA